MPMKLLRIVRHCSRTEKKGGPALFPHLPPLPGMQTRFPVDDVPEQLGVFVVRVLLCCSQQAL